MGKEGPHMFIKNAIIGGIFAKYWGVPLPFFPDIVTKSHNEKIRVVKQYRSPNVNEKWKKWRFLCGSELHLKKKSWLFILGNRLTKQLSWGKTPFTENETPFTESANVDSATFIRQDCSGTKKTFRMKKTNLEEKFCYIYIYIYCVP